MKKGKFVVIEGLDGSGKKTQLDLLVKYCQKHKIKITTLDFPQYYKTFFGKLVGRYLKGEFGKMEQGSPYLASLLYAGDRWQAKEKMEKALKEGRLLLANRYTFSNMAFMGAKIKSKIARDRFIKWLMKLEWQVYGIPEPDLVIFLSLPPEIGQRLVDKKGWRKYAGNKNRRDIHERNLAFLKKVTRVYLDLTQRFDNWVKIDCVDKKGNLLSIKEIHQKILKVLRKGKFCNDRSFTSTIC